MESGKCLKIREKTIPVAPQVKGACDLRVLILFYVANEGIVMAVVEPSVAKTVLAGDEGSMRTESMPTLSGLVEESPGGMVLSGDPRGRYPDHRDAPGRASCRGYAEPYARIRLFFEMKKKRARLMSPMRRAILPISTKRIPDNASNPPLARTRLSV